MAAPPDSTATPAASTFDVPRRLVSETILSNGQVTVGPDRFPYVSGFRAVVAGRSDSKPYAMRALAQLALSKHAGIAVYEAAATENPLWVFSLGAVAALAMNKWTPYDRNTALALAPGEHLVTGTPSLDALPADLRRAIADYMQSTDGIATPKVALIAVKSAAGAYKPPPYMMAPNLPRSGFASEAAWMEELHRIEWFIPPEFVTIRPPPAPERFEVWFTIVDPLVP